MWQSGPLDGPKRKVYLLMLPLMAAAALIDWRLQLSGISDPVGRIAAPLGALFDVVMAFVLWRIKGSVRFVERLGVAIFVFAMLAKVYALLLVVPDTSGDFASFAMWFGPLYVAIFLVYETKHAIVLSGLVYSAVLCMGMLRIGLMPSTSNGLLKSLTHLYTSNGTLIAFLILYTWIKDRLITVQTVADRMTQLAHTDFLVGVPNRRELYRSLSIEMDRSRTHRRSLSVILLDIDHFKRVNDLHGHHVGDKLLVEMARRIMRSLGPQHQFGRWGGEEFMIICPEADIRDAEQTAVNVRETICQQPFDVVGAVTASFGVSSCREGLTLDSVIRRADAALYKAKANGRNRVELDLVDVG